MLFLSFVSIYSITSSKLLFGSLMILTILTRIYELSTTFGGDDINKVQEMVAYRVM